VISIRALFAVLLVAGVAAQPATAQSGAPTPGAAQVILLPSYKSTSGVSQVLTDDRYAVLAGPGSQATGAPAVLIDEQTRQRTALSPPGCWPAALGGGWLAFSCGNTQPPTVDLYGLADGAWH
jgi:hypothetical protein